MRPVIVFSVRVVLTASIVALALVLALPHARALVVDVYLLVLASLVVLVLLAATIVAHVRRRSLFEAALEPRGRRPHRPDDLERLERQVLLATRRAFDFHLRVRPLLREIAEFRLSSRRGVDLDRSPDQAAAVVGPDAWRVLRPDVEAPAEPFARGIGNRGLRELLDILEGI